MEQQTSKPVPQESRRRFITKAATGSVLLSLPAKSVWANGITNSIVASGHGSDWADGQSLRLQDVGYWTESNMGNYASQSFVSVFGGSAFRGTIDAFYPGAPVEADYTLGEIMFLRSREETGSGGSAAPGNSGNSNSNSTSNNGNARGNSSGEASIDNSLAGPGDYNRLLIAMYLNAVYGNNGGDIYYPVANGRPFASPEAFARRLYELTSTSPFASAQSLTGLIHNPSSMFI